MRKAQHPVSMGLIFIVLIIVLLLAVLLILVIKKPTDTTQDYALCSSQVQASAAITRLTKDISSPAITCPTKFVTVSGDPNAVIAQQMKRCWDIWGQGKLQLFGDKEGVYCHVCSLVTVDTPATGLSTYLDTAKANDAQTYSQYLTGQKSGTYFDDQTFKGQTVASIPADKPVGVIFVYAKGQQWYNNLRNSIAKPAVGAAAGGAVGIYLAGGVVSALGGWLPAVGALAVYTTGATAGAGGGLIVSNWARADSSYMAIVAVRPLTNESISELGCQYDPVKN